MKVILLVPILTLLFILTVRADSRVLIQERTGKCLVANDEILWSGLLAAKKEIYKQRTIKFDSITFIKSKNRKNNCGFLFDLFVEEEHLARAEIILSKSDWQALSRRIFKGNDEAHW